MLSFLLTFLLLKSTLINSQLLTTRVLDSVLQEHAFAPFLRHRVVTGVVYDANVGPELTGIRVSALRLRSGALRRKGYVGFKEFDIPAGVVVSPYVGRVVLVYQNMGNWSSVYYGLKGYVFLSPVVGLLAYNASFLSPETLLELDVLAVEEPMVVKFGGLKVLRNGLVPKCVYFDLFGGVEFDHVVNGSVCLSVKQGHFGVVVEDGVPVAAPENVPENPIAIGDGGGGGGGRDGGGGGGDWWWVGGVVVGCGVVVVVIVAVLLVVVSRCRRRRMIEKMECAAEGGVPLAVVAVGGALVPVATETRTKPILENEYVS